MPAASVFGTKFVGTAGVSTGDNGVSTRVSTPFTAAVFKLSTISVCVACLISSSDGALKMLKPNNIPPINNNPMTEFLSSI